MFRNVRLVILVAILIIAAGCDDGHGPRRGSSSNPGELSPVPTSTPPEPTASASATPSPSTSPTSSPTPTASSTFSSTSTSTATRSPTATAVATFSTTATRSPSSSPTSSATPTDTATLVASPVDTATPTPTPSALPTASASPTEDPRRPYQPAITSPFPEGVEGIAASDVHMEITEFFDLLGDQPLDSEWEIEDVLLAARVWRGVGRDLEISHVHLSNGRFEGPLSGMNNLDFDRLYRLRARYRDASGDPATEYSKWSDWRHFRTAAFGIPPLAAAGALADPRPTWNDEAGMPIEDASLLVRLLRAPLADNDDFTVLLTWRPVPDGEVRIFPHGGAQAVVLQIESGSDEISLPPSRMTLTLVSAAGDAETAVLYLPAMTLEAHKTARFWVAQSGATFTALATQGVPDFSVPVRETETAWSVPPGYVVEEVAGGLTFPTQVILASETPATGEPHLLVMELKGRVWAVDAAGEKWIYADDLLDFTSSPPSSNIGQVGLGGMALHPHSGDLFVTRTYRGPAPPIEWVLDETLPGWTIFLPGTAAWATGAAETIVVRYREIPGDGSDWSFGARIEYPRFDGVQRWTAGTAFGLVVYGDKDNALFFNFQSNRYLIELLTENQRRLELERPTSPLLAGWLRIDSSAGRLRFFYRGEAEQPWSLVHEMASLPFTPTRVGINPRNFGRLVGTARFSEIEADGVLIDPSILLDHTVQTQVTWLHNQVVRLRATEDGRTAGDLEVVLDMPDDISHESHQIQDIDVATDGTLFVSVGDGFNPVNARDPTTFLGKILRMNADGSAPSDNPFYDPENPTAPVSYIHNSGVRNTYGMAVRKSDGRLFCSENGPSRDRFYSPEAGWDMGYDGTDRSMLTNALFTWPFPIAPVGIDVMQTGAFPGFEDRLFMATAGQDFTLGISKTGKRVLVFDVDTDGRLVGGPDELLRYEGSSRATVIGLAFASDGLYFTTLYNTDPTRSPFSDARLMRVRRSPVEGN